MKTLIINADDYGLTEGINKGIIEGYRKGIIKDMSLIAGGEAYESAVNLARKNNIKNLGVHIVLSDSQKIPDKCYRFPWGYFLGTVDRERVYSEVKGQIEKVRRDGFNITHLDSHQHIHMAHEILKIFIRAAKESGINYIRFPREQLTVDITDLKNTAKSVFLKAIVALSGKTLADSGLKFTDSFYGHFYSGRLYPARLVKFLSGLKDGVAEISCHPGYFTADMEGIYTWHRNCDHELAALLSPVFSDALTKYDIKLASFSDI